MDESYIEATDDQLLKRIRRFAISVADSSSASFSACAQRIIQSIDKMVRFSYLSKHSIDDPQKCPDLSPTLPVMSPSSSGLQASHTALESPQLLAGFLTSIEYERYTRLRGHNYICWLEGKEDGTAVSDLRLENKKLSYWAERSVLNVDNQSKRAATLKYFLLVIKVC